MSGSLNRLRILIALLEKPMHSSQIAKEFGFERMYIGFYMSMLESKGLVDGEYKIIEHPTVANKFKGKAGKFYKTSEKGEAYLNFVLMNINFYERAWNMK